MPDSAYLIPAYLLPGLPFVVFLILWLGGRRLNKSAGWIGALVTAAGLGISLLYADPEMLHTVRFTWLTIGDTPIELSFRFDTLTCVMLVVVHFVAVLVHIPNELEAFLFHDKPNIQSFQL